MPLSLSSASPERQALQEDCLQVLTSLTCSPNGLHLLASSGCPQLLARLLTEGSGREKVSMRQLLELVLGQEPVATRHEEMVEETVCVLAAGFRERQVRE